VGNNLPTVLLEKDVHQDKSDTLITVDEWMVPANVETIGSGIYRRLFCGRISHRQSSSAGQVRTQEGFGPEAQVGHHIVAKGRREVSRRGRQE